VANLSICLYSEEGDAHAAGGGVWFEVWFAFLVFGRTLAKGGVGLSAAIATQFPLQSLALG
jgi:hypothetical protein